MPTDGSAFQKALGVEIRAARRRTGMTQAGAAEAAKIALPSLASLEGGKGSVRTLLAVMSAFKHRLHEQSPDVELGQWLSERRRLAGFSQQRLADHLGIAKATVINVEKGKGHLKTLCSILTALGVSPRLCPTTEQTLAPAGFPQCLPRVVAHSDCVIGMRGLDSGSVDLVLTSPPYNAGKPYEAALSEAEYAEQAERWFSEVPRILSPAGSLWLNVGQMAVANGELLPLAYIYFPLLRRLGLHFRQEIVWHFEGGLAYKRRFSPRTERWMWWTMDPANFTFNLDAVRDLRLNRTQDKRNNPLGKNPTDLWYFNRVVGGRGAGPEKTIHPCQFPVAMAERVILACSNKGDVVLDPFGGSGSTAAAAKKNGRGFIHFERDDAFHQVATDRICTAA